jgi:hypothetical protein
MVYNSLIEELEKISMFSPSMQKLKSFSTGSNVKPTFNVNNPMDTNKHIYSGGIRTNSMMPKNNLTPTVNAPIKSLN